MSRSSKVWCSHFMTQLGCWFRMGKSPNELTIHSAYLSRPAFFFSIATVHHTAPSLRSLVKAQFNCRLAAWNDHFHNSSIARQQPHPPEHCSLIACFNNCIAILLVHGAILPDASSYGFFLSWSPSPPCLLHSSPSCAHPPCTSAAGAPDTQHGVEAQQ